MCSAKGRGGAGLRFSIILLQDNAIMVESKVPLNFLIGFWDHTHLRPRPFFRKKLNLVNIYGREGLSWPITTSIIPIRAKNSANIIKSANSCQFFFWSSPKNSKIGIWKYWQNENLTLRIIKVLNLSFTWLFLGYFLYLKGSFSYVMPVPYSVGYYWHLKFVFLPILLF